MKIWHRDIRKLIIVSGIHKYCWETVLNSQNHAKGDKIQGKGVFRKVGWKKKFILVPRA